MFVIQFQIQRLKFSKHWKNFSIKIITQQIEKMAEIFKYNTKTGIFSHFLPIDLIISALAVCLSYFCRGPRIIPSHHSVYLCIRPVHSCSTTQKSKTSIPLQSLSLSSTSVMVFLLYHIILTRGREPNEIRAEKPTMKERRWKLTKK